MIYRDTFKEDLKKLAKKHGKRAKERAKVKIRRTVEQASEARFDVAEGLGKRLLRYSRKRIPLVFGMDGTAGATVTWLDPFKPAHSQHKHEVDHTWSWADAPNVMVGDEEVVPMGKRLLESPTYDGPAIQRRQRAV